MEGYSVTEAASVLGVPTERVWELLARGVLSGAPEGETGMRVYLQPRPAPAPPEPKPANGDGDPREPERELSPFRELLTEFRNLTERYGQALLALGEARGEVASLRSRVDVLEARMDLRLPTGTAPLAPSWGAPSMPEFDERSVTPAPASVPDVKPAPDAAATVDEPTVASPVQEVPPAEEEPRSRARGPRRAIESFADALARADDPSVPELPGRAEVASTLAALREETVRDVELPREAAATESMAVADEITGTEAPSDRVHDSELLTEIPADDVISVADVEEGEAVEVQPEPVELAPPEPEPVGSAARGNERPAPDADESEPDLQSLAGAVQPAAEPTLEADEEATVYPEAAADPLTVTDTEVVAPAEPEPTTEPAAADLQPEPIEPEQPTEPVAADLQPEPIEPEQPTEPVAADLPAEPIEPEQPTEPVATEQPPELIEPEQPTEPIAPPPQPLDWDADRYTTAIEEPDWLAGEPYVEASAHEAIEEPAPAGAESAAADDGGQPSPDAIDMEPAAAPEVLDAPAEPPAAQFEMSGAVAAREAGVEAVAAESPAEPPAEPADEPADEPASEREPDGPESVVAEVGPTPEGADPASVSSRAGEETVLWFGRSVDAEGASEMEVAPRAQPPQRELPGGRDLDEALAALEELRRASSSRAQPAADEWPPARRAAPGQASRPTALPTPGSPAGRAYRRLRRIFPG